MKVYLEAVDGSDIDVLRILVMRAYAFNHLWMVHVTESTDTLGVVRSHFLSGHFDSQGEADSFIYKIRGHK